MEVLDRIVGRLIGFWAMVLQGQNNNGNGEVEKTGCDGAPNTSTPGAHTPSVNITLLINYALLNTTIATLTVHTLGVDVLAAVFFVQGTFGSQDRETAP